MRIEITYYSLDSAVPGARTKQIGYKQENGVEYIPTGNHVAQLTKEEFEALDVRGERKVEGFLRDRNLDWLLEFITNSEGRPITLPAAFYRNLKKVFPD